MEQSVSLFTFYELGNSKVRVFLPEVMPQAALTTKSPESLVDALFIEAMNTKELIKTEATSQLLFID